MGEARGTQISGNGVGGELAVDGFEHGVDERDGQADYVEVAADNARNPAAGVALDGVGAGLVHWLPSGYVSKNFFVRHREHGDAGGFGGNFHAVRRNKTNAGDDLMCASGEQTQHARRIRFVDGLVENFMIADDDGVRSEDEQGIIDCVAMVVRAENGVGLFARQPLDEMDGIFAGARLFGDRDELDLEGEASLSEQFAASWGCGGKDEHGTFERFHREWGMDVKANV